MNRRRTLLWIAASACCALLPLRAAEEGKAAAQPTVQMVIDYHDGVEKHFTAIPHTAGMTVADCLTYAAKHPHGVKHASTGRGATLFVAAIDGIENEGGTDGKNWVYYVNDRKGNKSCGAHELKAGDRVKWRFEVFEP